MKFSKNHFILLFIVLGTFLPAITTDYFFHDDLSLLENKPGSYAKYPLFDLCIAVGRPLLAVLLSLCDWSVHHIEDLRRIRLISLFEIFVSGCLLMHWFKKVSIKDFHSLLLSIAIIMLPAFQVFASYAGTAPNCIPIILSLSAALLTLTIEPRQSFSRWLIQKNSLKIFILLFSSLLIYPATTMFYWGPVASLILFANTQTVKPKGTLITYYLTLGSLAIGCYALYLKTSQSFTSQIKIYDPLYNPNITTPNIFKKIQWFLSEPFPNAANLWNIYPEPFIANGIFIFLIATGMIATLLSIKNKEFSFFKISASLCLILTLLIFSYLPNIMASSEAPWYRCSGALSAILFFIIIAAFQYWTKFLGRSLQNKTMTIILIVFCTIGIFQARINITQHRITPSQLETQHITHMLKNVYDQEQHNAIHFIIPDQASSNIRNDEFGLLSTHIPFNIPAILVAICNDLNIGKKIITNQVPISYGLAKDTSQKDIKTLIINTNNVFKQHYPINK